jgi:opine dehydrogenase
MISSGLMFAVLGAGDGGKAMAAHLASKQFTVNLYNRRDGMHYIDLTKIKAQGGIELEGVVDDFGMLNVVSSDIGRVIKDVDVIMVVTWAQNHPDVARICAPHLQDGQVVLLNPGRTGGALDFKQALNERGCKAKIKLAEAQTLIFAARSTSLTRSRILGVKKQVPIAALPSSDTDYVLERVKQAYDQFIPAQNIFETGLNNVGAIIHPSITLLNSGRIESTKGDFEFYFDGATPSVCKVMEAIDAERLRVAHALGVEAMSTRDWLNFAYDVQGRTLYEALHKNEAYRGIKSTPTIEHRYIFEDVPTGLVPIASMGEMLDITCPSLKMLISLASTMLRIEFWSQGRTVERLGLKGKTVEEILEFVS